MENSDTVSDSDISEVELDHHKENYIDLMAHEGGIIEHLLTFSKYNFYY